jgi:hypothetical protein
MRGPRTIALDRMETLRRPTSNGGTDKHGACRSRVRRPTVNEFGAHVTQVHTVTDLRYLHQNVRWSILEPSPGGQCKMAGCCPWCPQTTRPLANICR